MALDKSAILGADDLKTKEIDVPEWGGPVRLREWTAATRDEFEEWILNQAQDADVKTRRARYVAWSIVDDDNELMFGEDDIPGLAKKSANVLTRLLKVVQDQNGLGVEAVDESEKN